MKTRIIIAGVIVAAISTFTMSSAQAQSESVRIIPTIEKDVIKIIYANGLHETVNIKFSNREEVLSTDKIYAKQFQGGFFKKYNVEQMSRKPFWVEISNSVFSVTYKMKNTGGKWSAQLESTTNVYPTVAVN